MPVPYSYTVFSSILVIAAVKSALLIEKVQKYIPVLIRLRLRCILNITNKAKFDKIFEISAHPTKIFCIHSYFISILRLIHNYKRIFANQKKFQFIRLSKAAE